MNPQEYVLICQAYKTLCRTNFAERDTEEGQSLLAGLRDAIAEFTGQDAEEVQDWAES